MKIPQDAQKILQRLNDHGFQAYAVGGCVRDSLLGTVPEDWDICTSALPKETEDCFSNLRVVETGLKHGTVTVISEGVPYEITTFEATGTIWITAVRSRYPLSAPCGRISCAGILPLTPWRRDWTGRFRIPLTVSRI